MDCFVAMSLCLPRSEVRILPAWTGLTAHSLRFSKSGATAAFHVKGKDLGTCIRGHVIQCILTKAKDSSIPTLHNLEREPHKYFDHVVITVRSGDGGHGAVLNMPRPRTQVRSPGRNKKEKEKRKGSYRRDPDGSLILPMGGHGGDVVLYADESKDSLLELHQIRRYSAKRGGNVDAMGVLSPMLHDGFIPPTLRIPVPVGTVVKRKRGGKLLADLAHPGDQIVVAKGGRGGFGINYKIFYKYNKVVLGMDLNTTIINSHGDQHTIDSEISLVETSQRNRSQLSAVNVNIMRDKSDKVMVFGQPGEEVTLELILRIVADVGLVGLPNAGKSSLLASITLAKPEIANYPFTTLMPNLGRLDGDPDMGIWGFSSRATLADLPGLIRGAHLGKGLGRTFLRHLRRTRLLVHVVDASADDPVQDYRTLREELRMYNPNYLERPHMVVLNKLDLPEAKERFDSMSKQIERIGSLEDVAGGTHMLVEGNSCGEGESCINSEEDNVATSLTKEKEMEEYPCPVAVVGISALKGIGIVHMLKQIRLALKACESDNNKAMKMR